MARVLILIGSDSDREYFNDVGKYAAYFGFDFELKTLSAHRNPDELRETLRRAPESGVQIIVAAAGMAAHLAGVCAAESLLPVIGVPLPGSALSGMDSLLSTVQMPSGVPVATVAIGKAGAVNAIVLAARIFALTDPNITARLREFRTKGSRI